MGMAARRGMRVALHYPGSPAGVGQEAAGLLKALPRLFGLLPELSREYGP